jgi:LacI family transcriptional regulator
LIIRTDTADDFDAKAPKLLESHKIDGIFALDEHTSVSAMKMGLKNNYKIPEELCIIGLPRRLVAKAHAKFVYSKPTLPEIGEAAAKLLIARLEKNSQEETQTYKTEEVKTELRQRESTRKL